MPLYRRRDLSLENIRVSRLAILKLRAERLSYPPLASPRPITDSRSSLIVASLDPSSCGALM